jgi:hypothetical protein
LQKGVVVKKQEIKDFFGGKPEMKVADMIERVVKHRKK